LTYKVPGKEAGKISGLAKEHGMSQQEERHANYKRERRPKGWMLCRREEVLKGKTPRMGPA
jgi:hypothetical protein